MTLQQAQDYGEKNRTMIYWFSVKVNAGLPAKALAKALRRQGYGRVKRAVVYR